MQSVCVLCVSMLPHREQAMILKKGKGFEHLWKVTVFFYLMTELMFLSDSSLNSMEPNCPVILSNFKELVW